VLGIDSMISESTAQWWLKFKLGYQSKEAKKGIYVDGHECPDVIKERQEFIHLIFDKYEWLVGCAQCPRDLLTRYNRLMSTYDDQSLQCIPPTLQPGEKEHVLVMQDETVFHTNEYRR
jgi:hypothetical protein